MRLRITLAMAALAAVPLSAAGANSLTESSTLSFTGPLSSYDFPALKGFDPTLGMLTSATLSMGGVINVLYAPASITLCPDTDPFCANPADGLSPPNLFGPNLFGPSLLGPGLFGSSLNLQEAPLGDSSITGGGQDSQLQDGPNAVAVNLQGTVDDLSAVGVGPDRTPVLYVNSNSNMQIVDGSLEADLTFTYDSGTVADGTPVPEPLSASLLAAGLLGFGFLRRRAAWDAR